MKRVIFSVLAAAVLGLAAASGAPAQTPASTASSAPPAVNRSGAPVDVDGIIRRIAAKEAEFRKALNEYSFKRDAVIQTIAFGGQISGEYHRVSSFVFDDSGNRYEKILKFPIPTLTEIQLTADDLEDFGGVQALLFSISTRTWTCRPAGVRLADIRWPSSSMAINRSPT